MLNGVARTLQDVNTENPALANYILLQSLAQYVGDEPLMVVPSEKEAVTIRRKGRRKTAAGGNGKPFGSDVTIVSETQIRKLCTIAGWFKEVNRDYKRWRDEMWTLQNIADDWGLGDKLDQLMIDVSKVWKGPHRR